MMKYCGTYKSDSDVDALKQSCDCGWSTKVCARCVVLYTDRYSAYYKGKDIEIYLLLDPDKEPTSHRDLYFFMRDERDDSFFDTFDTSVENVSYAQTATQMVYNLLHYNTAERNILVHLGKLDEKLMLCIAGMDYCPWSMAFNLHVEKGIVICSIYNGIMAVKVGNHFEYLYYDTTTAKLYTKHPETGEYTIPEGIHITKITVNKQ